MIFPLLNFNKLSSIKSDVGCTELWRGSESAGRAEEGSEIVDRAGAGSIIAAREESHYRVH